MPQCYALDLESSALRFIGILHLFFAAACLYLGWQLWRADTQAMYAGSYLPQFIVAALLLMSAIGNLGSRHIVHNSGELQKPRTDGMLLLSLCGAMLLILRVTPMGGKGSGRYTENFLAGFVQYIEPFSFWLLLLGCLIIASAVLSYVLEYSAWKQHSAY
ncbi:hypothetical protein IT575_15395 [bacterium]|nr:hypothetical protein [bacterium]